MTINWKAVSQERISEAGIYGQAALQTNDPYTAYHRAMQAAHFAFLACPELGEN